MRFGAAAACAFAERCPMELRNGAATQAPPRPRRKILRFMWLVMFGFPRFSRSLADSQTEGICLGEVGEQLQHRIAVLAHLDVQLLDEARVVRVGLPSRRVGNQLLGVNP